MSAGDYFRSGHEPKRINLVQRCAPTVERPIQDPINLVKAAGVQLVDGDGKLSDEAKQLMHRLFTWDYMGASEFEFGTVPFALKKMAEEKDDYVINWTDIAPGSIPTDRLYENMSGKSPIPDLATRVWFLCRKNHVHYLQEILPFIANETHRLEERAKLGRAVKYGIDSEDILQSIAWLDISNGSFWAIDDRLVRAMGLLLCEIPPA